MKFETFVNVLQQSDVVCETLEARRAAKIISDSEHYCEDYYVDCELVACTFMFKKFYLKLKEYNLTFFPTSIS